MTVPTVSTVYDVFTGAFWRQTVTLSIHGAATGMLSVLGARTVDQVTDLPWYGIATAGVIGAVTAVLVNLSAATLPRVVPAGFVGGTPVAGARIRSKPDSREAP